MRLIRILQLISNQMQNNHHQLLVVKHLTTMIKVSREHMKFWRMLIMMKILMNNLMDGKEVKQL